MNFFVEAPADDPWNRKVRNWQARHHLDPAAQGKVLVGESPIARKYGDVEYNPERFPGLVMRIAEPKATILVFSTGKMVVTGMRREEEAEAVVDQVIKRNSKASINVSDPQLFIQNIVASGDLSRTTSSATFLPASAPLSSAWS